ncbi:hypothetical protein [Caldanaerobius polysaccharolyticus]|uniref:hypothetical protein n=1 Tax=Caldanaerobius polysaccharolyticus TaxID=44256 RepID=UPI00047C68AD|nr:hypothetical protein [Caldanaerobius polysaccharolyticus]
MVAPGDEVVIKEIHAVLDKVNEVIKEDRYLLENYRELLKNDGNVGELVKETADPVRESIAKDIAYIYKKLSEATLYDKIIY